MSIQRSVLIGLFFLLTLGVLGYYTLFLTNFTLFHEQPELVAQFSQANGLREGDSVLVAGVRWGRVKTMTFDATAPNERRITVTAVLDEPLVLREGFKITIKDATMLGGRNLEIEPGPPDAPPVEPGRALFGSVAPNTIEAIGNFVRDNEPRVNEIVDNFLVVTQNLRQGKGTLGRLLTDEGMSEDLASGVSAASKTLANVEAISSDLRAGHGTFGRLLTEPDLYDSLAESAKKLSEMLDESLKIATDVRQGQGLVPRLLSDPAMSEDVARALADFRVISGRLAQGEGTIGHLLTDDTIARNLENITRKLDDGEGTLGALFGRTDLYDNMLQATEDIAMITSQIRSGQGSLGQLVMSDDVYQQLRTALQIVQRSLEEFRESAPVTTFTSVFFGAF